MSEPRTALQKTPLKEELQEEREREGSADEESGGDPEPKRQSGFESLIPGEGRRHLFKRPKGRIGMG